MAGISSRIYWPRAPKCRAIDKKPLDDWWQLHSGVDNRQLDLSERDNCLVALKGASEAYNLAADMGGMGFIENNKALCMLSVLINTHMLMAAKEHGVDRYFYASSRLRLRGRQAKVARTSCRSRKTDAYPAMPEDGYGWEKLFSERMCRHFREDFGMTTRVARFHNVYGPHGTWDGGREKAPAAICRKVIQAKLSGKHEIEIWGDGKQTRSFMYIDDCLQGTQSDPAQRHPRADQSGQRRTGDDQRPGRHRRRASPASSSSGATISSAPKGVNGRNSDNTLITEASGLGAWHPAARRYGEDLRLDLRPDREQQALPGVLSLGCARPEERRAWSIAAVCVSVARTRPSFLILAWSNRV